MKLNVHSDETYQIMNAITENEKISQRELSLKLGISLGAVNALINKMVMDGLVKIEKIPPKRVLYMLTPMGMMEKARKTISYVKIHYEAIKGFLGQLEVIFETYMANYDVMYILRTGSPYDDVLVKSVRELKHKNAITVVDDLSLISKSNRSQVVFYISEDDIESLDIEVEKINLLRFF